MTHRLPGRRTLAANIASMRHKGSIVSDFASKSKTKIPLILLCTSYLVLCWRRLLIQGRIPLDGNIITLSYPNWVVSRSFLMHARLPLWNPLRDMGEPFLADPQTMSGYPLFWAISWLPTFTGFFQFWVVLHTCIACLFMALLIHQQHNGLWPVVGAAIFFGFNGFFTNHLTPNVFATLAWAPAALYFLERRSWKGLGIVSALQWLAGFPDFLLLTVLVIGAFALSGGKQGVMTLWRAGLLALGISAFQFIPFLQLFLLSARPLILTTDSALQFSMPPLQLLKEVFAPLWIAYAPETGGDPAITSFYAGIIAMGLSGWAIYRGKARERLLGGVILAALLLSLGAFLPGYKLMRFLHLFCYPAHWLFVVTLALSLLVGDGIAHIRSKSLQKIVVLALGAELAIFCQFPRIAWFEESFLQAAPALTNYFKDQPFPTRIYHTNPFLHLWNSQDLRSVEGFLGFKNYMVPSYGASFGISDVQNHQVLLLQRAASYQNRLAAAGPQSPLTQYAGISLVVTPDRGVKDLTQGPIRVVTINRAKAPVFQVPERTGQSVRLLSYEPGKVDALVSTPLPSRLVFNQVAVPGWKWKLNGRPVNWSYFEETFSSIELPKGTHQISIYYRPLAFFAGLIISLGTCLFLIFGMVQRRNE